MWVLVAHRTLLPPCDRGCLVRQEGRDVSVPEMGDPTDPPLQSQTVEDTDSEVRDTQTEGLLLSGDWGKLPHDVTAWARAFPALLSTAGHRVACGVSVTRKPSFPSHASSRAKSNSAMLAHNFS